MNCISMPTITVCQTTALRLRGGPESEEKHYQPEQADGAVGASVVCALLADEGSEKYHSDYQRCCERDAQFLRDHLCKSATRLVPGPVHWPRYVGDWYVERDDSNGDEQPEKEWHDPIHIVVMEGQSSRPPCCDYTPYYQMEPDPVSAVETRVFVALWIGLLLLGIGDSRVFAFLDVADVYIVAFFISSFL